MTGITQKQLKELLEYRDGELYWKVSPAKNVFIGDKAGGIDNKGRVRVCINKKSYQAHRLIFLICYGHLPKMLDHIDGNPLNNKIENLRSANFSTNGFNRKISINNTSGVKGLAWNYRAKKWQVCIKANGNANYFGYYKHKEIGAVVAEMARHKLHGSFMRMN